MGVRSCLLATFRVAQFIFSLVALGCGAYITYMMYSLAENAKNLEIAILDLATTTDNDSIDTLSNTLVPVLRYLQSAPIRAISLSSVSLASVLLIIYLFFARRSKNHQGTNRQSIRVTLDVLMLVAWLGGLTCATLLALQYGILALGGGIAVKAAMKIARKALEKKLEDLASKSTSTKDALEALDMISSLVTIAILSIASVAAAFICLTASFISAIVACCTKTKKKQHFYEQHGMPMSATEPLNPSYTNGTPSTTYTDKSPRTAYNDRGSSYITDESAEWHSPPQQSWQSPQSRDLWSPNHSQGWDSTNTKSWPPREILVTPPVPYTPPTPFTGKPTSYMALTSSQQDPHHYVENSQYYGRHVAGADQWGR